MVVVDMERFEGVYFRDKLLLGVEYQLDVLFLVDAVTRVGSRQSFDLSTDITDQIVNVSETFLNLGDLTLQGIDFS